jgi:hypothetical protein
MSQSALVHARVASALGSLSRLFAPGCRLTFVMRDPKNLEAFMVIGDDTEDEVIATVERSRRRPVEVLTMAQVERGARVTVETWEQETRPDEQEEP